MKLIFLIAAFVVSYAGTFLVMKIASRRSILDIPNERSSHTVPTPRGGGLAIAITWLITIFLLMLSNSIPKGLFFACLCGMPIALIGFFDDILNISPRIRLVIQILCSTLAVISLGGLEKINIGFEVVEMKFVLSVICVIGLVWFTNLFNFLDGIDGYISTEIIFICFSSFILFGFETPLILAAATAGFLIWNWQPARIFMGDVGSTLLGFTVGIFSIYSQNAGESSIIAWLLLTSVFWFDATITLIRRLRNKEQISKAHKKHVYQRIVQSGFSHAKTVIWSLIINILVFVLTYLTGIFPKFLLPAFLINILFLYFITRIADRRMPFPK